MHDVDGLNAGFASAILEQYLKNPEAVPEEWRKLFESGSSELVAAHPGLARLVELLGEEQDGKPIGLSPRGKERRMIVQAHVMALLSPLARGCR